jgi:hypothetical protein
MIFSNRYFMNLKKSRAVLKNLIVSFVFLLMALFSPLIFLITDLPKVYNYIIPIGLILLSVVPFLNCMREIDSNRGCGYCSTKKEEHNFFRPVHHLVPNTASGNNGKKEIF